MKSNKNSFLFFLILFSITPAFSQNFTGKIIDKNATPIPGSSVFIRETKQGLMSNESGTFQTTLSPGTYHCEFSCIGYEKQEKQVAISLGQPVFLDIILSVKEFEIKEVLIDNSGEDPAYAIIRHAIEQAPFHSSQVKEFTSEAYLKGSGKLLTIPKLIEKIGGSDEISMYKNKVFLQESFSEIHFTAPDVFVQTVKGFSSTIPDDMEPKDALRLITINIYSPMLDTHVSPLHPDAFSYYKFRYEGYDEHGDEIINKIKIIPKLKDPKLVEGYIYIAENAWDIRHVDLIFNGYGVKSTALITMNEVREDIFLPAAYNLHANVDIMGVKAYFNYLSSIKYLNVEVNDSLIAQTKNIAKKKKNLEIKKDDKYRTESDSLATKQDSLFWTEVRNVPLNIEEIQSYIRKDTIQAFTDSIQKEKFHPKFEWPDLLTGGTVSGDSSNIYFNYGGLLKICPEYNFADGFWLGQSVELGIRRNKNSVLTIRPMAYWAEARKKFIWDAAVSYTYAPMRLGELSLSGGSKSVDYSGENGMLRIENAVNTLFTGVNDAKFYQKDYFMANNKIDITNGLRINLGIEIANRSPLENHADYSFFGDKKDIKSNTPEYAGSLYPNFTRLTKYSVDLTYTPEYYYSVKNDKKRYEHSRFPAFRIQYEQGIGSDNIESSQYNRLEGSVSQEIDFGVFDQLSYMVNGGAYLNNNNFNYIDYKHFNSSQTLFTGKSFMNSFILLDYYQHSTNDSWVQAFATYSSDYLLLKRVSFLQGKLFNESLHAKFLHTPDKQCYTEWGYSIGIPSAGSVGIFVSADKFNYNSFGVSISIPLIQTAGIKN